MRGSTQQNGRRPSRPSLRFQICMLLFLLVGHTTRICALLAPTRTRSHDVLNPMGIATGRDRWAARTYQNNPFENRRDLVVLASTMAPIVSYAVQSCLCHINFLIFCNYIMFIQALTVIQFYHH